MEPVLTDVTALSPHPRNSRTHSKEQITALGRAIREWGFLQPIVANEDGVVLIGHGRLEAAKAIGMAEVPVVFRKGLSEERQRALLISDNRLAEVGSTWERDILDEELRYLLGAEFDVTLTAFDLPEIPEVSDGEAADDAPVKPVSWAGDIWKLGRHRLGCASPYIPGKMATAVIGEHVPTLVVTRCEVPEALADALGHVATATVAYVWHEPVLERLVVEALGAAGFESRAQIIGKRPEPRRLASGYGRQHEVCWYAVRKGKPANWSGGRRQTTVWELAAGGKRLPAACYTRPITNHVPPGGSLYDPFVGDGTSIIAAHQTARILTGLEEDPIACDLAVQRWQNYSGLQAVHEGTGKTFADLQGERHGA